MQLLNEKQIMAGKIFDRLNENSEPFYQNQLGAAYLGDSLDLMKKLPDNSINLIVTSPPFALTSKKEYGNKASEDYVEWFMEFGKHFNRILMANSNVLRPYTEGMKNLLKKGYKAKMQPS